MRHANATVNNHISLMIFDMNFVTIVDWYLCRNYSGVQPSSLESNSVLLSYGSIPIGDSETITQTEPPNRPEIAYDGEYSDQEPLTLLPTYTSPEYTNDLLILRI